MSGGAVLLCFLDASAASDVCIVGWQNLILTSNPTHLQQRDFCSKKYWSQIFYRFFVGYSADVRSSVSLIVVVSSMQQSYVSWNLGAFALQL